MIAAGGTPEELDESELFRAREHSDDNFLVTSTGSISLLTESLRPRTSDTRRQVGHELGLASAEAYNNQHSLRQVPDAGDLDIDVDVNAGIGVDKGSDDDNEKQNAGGATASMADLTDKTLSTRLGNYGGQLTSLNLTNATALQGLFFDSLPTTIQHLDLTGCRSIKSEFFISYISKFFSLESLFLVGCEDLKDDALEAVVTFCPRLEGIAVPPDTTDAGLAALARSASLKRVGIRSCHHVSLGGIRFLLRSKPDLERVVVSKCLKVSSAHARERMAQRERHADNAMIPGSPPQLPTPMERRRSLNLEIMKEFVSN